MRICLINFYKCQTTEVVFILFFYTNGVEEKCYIFLYDFQNEF